MPAKIGRFVRDDDHVPDTSWDDRCASGAHIFLARLIRLDRLDELIAGIAEQGCK